MSDKNNNAARMTLSENAFKGIHPNFYTRVSNRIILGLLAKLPKPWPDEAIEMFLTGLAGFGRREILLKVSETTWNRVTLERDEFVCSELRLMQLSGRGRKTIRRILLKLAAIVRRTCSGRPIYRLTCSPRDQAHADSGTTPEITPDSSESGAKESSSGPGRSADQSNQEIEYMLDRILNKRENAASRPQDSNHSSEAGDPAERDRQKERSIATLRQARNLIPSERQRLMKQRGITWAELED